MAEVTPASIQGAADAINAVADNDIVESVVAKVAPRIPKHVRGALYEVGKWLGVAGTIGSTVAAALDGAPALYAASVAFLLLAGNNFLSKAHLSD